MNQVEITMSIKRCGFKNQFQDTWKIIFDLALILVAVAIGRFMGSSDAIQGMIVGAAMGVILHWRGTAKSSMCIKNTQVPCAKNWIETKGYVLNESNNEYIPNMHRLLRFDSQNIRFKGVNDSTTTMIGPYYILKMFSKNSHD